MPIKSKISTEEDLRAPPGKSRLVKEIRGEEGSVRYAVADFFEETEASDITKWLRITNPEIKFTLWNDKGEEVFVDDRLK